MHLKYSLVLMHNQHLLWPQPSPLGAKVQSFTQNLPGHVCLFVRWLITPGSGCVLLWSGPDPQVLVQIFTQNLPGYVLCVATKQTVVCVAVVTS